MIEEFKKLLLSRELAPSSMYHCNEVSALDFSDNDDLRQSKPPHSNFITELIGKILQLNPKNSQVSIRLCHIASFRTLRTDYTLKMSNFSILGLRITNEV
jgi:hypothetical protein